MVFAALSAWAVTHNNYLHCSMEQTAIDKGKMQIMNLPERMLSKWQDFSKTYVQGAWLNHFISLK